MIAPRRLAVDEQIAAAVAAVRAWCARAAASSARACVRNGRRTRTSRRRVAGAAELELMANWPGWTAKLSGGCRIEEARHKFLTLADVRDFILDQPEHIQERSFWQHAAELLINAAVVGELSKPRPGK